MLVLLVGDQEYLQDKLEVQFRKLYLFVCVSFLFLVYHFGCLAPLEGVLGYSCVTALDAVVGVYNISRGLLLMLNSILNFFRACSTISAKIREGFTNILP